MHMQRAMFMKNKKACGAMHEEAKSFLSLFFSFLFWRIQVETKQNRQLTQIILTFLFRGFSLPDSLSFSLFH